MTRLAIITTHPIQYYAPWFGRLAGQTGLDLRVFYLWDFGITNQIDPQFGQAVRWDVPLLEGYAHEFVPNRSTRPGTDHFWGIHNPDLPRRLKAFGPDAVLCMGYNYATFAGLLRRWDRKASPLLLRGDSHRLYPRKGWKAWLKERVLAAVFRRFAAFLYVGAANRDYLRIHGAPHKKMFFSPHAVDNDRFMAAAPQAAVDAADWKQELGVPPHRQVILFVGKFEEKKRPLDLLDAFESAQLPNAALLFVGSGALEQLLRQRARAMPHVYFAPFQNQSLMPRAYAAGDVVVLPSFGSSETWGLCVNEAMCLEKPAIVSSHVGCSLDLVLPGKTGQVFEAGNREALREALCQVVSNAAKLKQMGANARELVASYSYAQSSKGLFDALSYLNCFHRP
jgi:glycosyltransferase involved in cell wall biosynthesis